MRSAIVCFALLLCSCSDRDEAEEFAPLEDRDELTFLTQYRRASFAETINRSWSDEFSGTLQFPDLPGAQRSAFVSVSLTPPGELGIPPGENVPPDPELIGALALKAELIDAAGAATEIPLFFAPSNLTAAVMDVPAGIVSFRFQVAAAVPGVNFYITGAAVSTQEVEQIFRRLKRLADEICADGDDLEMAKSLLTSAESIFLHDLVFAEQAEALTREATMAILSGDIARAQSLFQAAREKLEDALASLTQAKNVISQILSALNRLTDLSAEDAARVARARADLEQLRGRFCAIGSIIRGHFWLHERTLYDLPEIRVVVSTTTTISSYSRVAMILNVGSDDPEMPSVLKHELGHAVYAKKTGINNLVVTSPHYPSQPSHPESAWSEGFATFFAQACLGNPNYESSNRYVQNIEDNTWTTATATTPMAVTAMGGNVEANVQSALWDILDGGGSVADSDGDGLSVPFSTIWQCVCQNPRTFADFLACLGPRLSPAEQMQLMMVLMRNRI